VQEEVEEVSFLSCRDLQLQHLEFMTASVTLLQDPYHTGQLLAVVVWGGEGGWGWRFGIGMEVGMGMEMRGGG
jgi:hypothetical protein